MNQIILVGAGGHAKSVIDCIDYSKYQLAGFIDEYNSGEIMNIPIIGKEICDIPNFRRYAYFVTIGDNENRKRWYAILQNNDLDIINIIDRTAVVSRFVQLGYGNFIGKHAVVNTDAQIGDNNIINTKALIEHECKVGSHIHISTNAVINGNVIVEDLAFLGSSCVCNCKIQIGYNSVIGSGSVVVRDIPANVTAVGNPAKVIKRRS